MGELILKVTDLSKQYRLGQLGTGTLSHDLNRMWARLRGKEDPYLKLGDANDRSKAGGSEYVWSLRDVSFEVNKGDVLGIVGKNGAGKSTLLKILSQVTTPTKGQIKVKGRIAALLEVGTGFHPELTGRENIFLNGAILGMTKFEIKSKLDEIVEFSGVAKYLDTPVKRYSSGMLVRLGFAVAAHLEPEILIVDEVLAVGDAEFQEKCLGKMKDVSGQGRTVLFVSHNLPAIRNLCRSGLYLKHGCVLAQGKIEDVLTEYISENRLIAETGEIPKDFQRSVAAKDVFFRKICLSNAIGSRVKLLQFGEPFRIRAELELLENFSDCSICFIVLNGIGDPVLFVTDPCITTQTTRKFAKGSVAVDVEVTTKLMPGNYNVTAGFIQAKTGSALDWVEGVYNFKVGKDGYKGVEDYPYYTVHGVVQPETNWNYTD